MNNQKIGIVSCDFGNTCALFLRIVDHPQLGKQASFKLFLESREKDKRYNAMLCVVLKQGIRPQLCIEGVSLPEYIKDDGFVKDELYKGTTVLIVLSFNPSPDPFAG